MSRESHKRFLEQSARRAATRAKNRAGRKALTIQDVRQLKIQTVEPWKRVVLFVFGVLFGGAGVVTLTEDIAWVGGLLLVVAFALISIALIGRKKTIERVLDVIDVGDILSGIVDLIDI